MRRCCRRRRVIVTRSRQDYEVLGQTRGIIGKSGTSCIFLEIAPSNQGGTHHCEHDAGRGNVPARFRGGPVRGLNAINGFWNRANRARIDHSDKLECPLMAKSGSAQPRRFTTGVGSKAGIGAPPLTQLSVTSTRPTPPAGTAPARRRDRHCPGRQAP